MSKLVRVVRLIAYEGPEEVVEAMIAKSKPEGRHDFGAMEMTVVTVESTLASGVHDWFRNNKQAIEYALGSATVPVEQHKVEVEMDYRAAEARVVPGTSTLMVQWAKGDPLIVSTRLHPKHGVIGNFERYSDNEGHVWVKLKGLMGLTELEAWQISRYDKESS